MARREIYFLFAGVFIELIAVGVGVMISKEIGFAIALFGVVGLAWSLWRVFVTYSIPDFKRAYRRSNKVWGLWHSGGRTRRNRLHIKYNSLKRILLLDPFTSDFAPSLENYQDTPEQAIEDITTLTREAFTKGIEVKWYPKMQTHAITFFNPNSAKAWVVIEEHTPLISCEDRPRKLVKVGKPEYEAAFQKFNKIWANARIPESREYGGEDKIGKRESRPKS